MNCQLSASVIISLISLLYYDTIPGLNREMGKLALEISHQTRLNAIAQSYLQNQ